MDEPEQIPPNRPSMIGRLRSLAIDLTPLRESRQFRLLFIGEAVSDLGSEITAVAVPYQVYQITAVAAGGRACSRCASSARS